MAATRETLRLIGELRVNVGQTVDEVTRKLVESWVLAFDEMYAELQAAVTDLAGRDGGWPAPWQTARASRAQSALAIAGQHLDRLAADARITIIGQLGHVVAQGAYAQPRILASQLPEQAGYGTGWRLDNVHPTAIDAIVARSAEQVTSLTWPLSSDATDAMRRSLIRGVTVGDNPRLAGAQMLRRLEGDFNGGLGRAVNIARTEMLDAQRAAQYAQDQTNTDLLAGWRWTASISSRTCPACLAMDGTEHPADEPGPNGHQSCRCTRTPIARSWQSLGFNIPEAPSVFPDAEQAFWSMSQADQLTIMGPARLEGLMSGDIAWQDLATVRSTAGWRDAVVPTPVRDLVGAGSKTN